MGEAISTFIQFIISRLATVILPLLLTLVVVLVGLRLIAIVNQLLERHIDTIYSSDHDRRSRLRTLLRTAVTTARAGIFTIAALVALGTVGIDLGPVLAAAGIVGLALSLGAQTLIKDYLGGLIILLEDQYRVGDSITVGNVSGTVERITLRRTNVRDLSGRLHILSNGDIRSVGNDTRDFAFALVEINLGLDADVDKAVAVLEEAMARAAADPEIAAEVLAPPEIAGWNQFSEWAVTVRLRTKVEPGEQWRVSRVIRRYAMEALRAAGVSIASRTRLQSSADDGV